MLSVIISLSGGLGLFLYGMKLMSDGIEKVAGSKLRSILEMFTKNRYIGLLVGIFFTAVIQSSSATTVMVVSFVNNGMMTLSQAAGVIFGANIGTTVTAMLVAFRLSDVAPLFIITGAIMVVFCKETMVRKAGDVVLGFGVLFFGISIMSAAMGELKEYDIVIRFLSNFTNPVLGVILGTVITSIVQSSSVTVSILVVMASQGLVDLHICFFVILGCNIGACTSALLTSLNGMKNAKRTALIHLLFNIFGTILMFVLLLFFSKQIASIVRFFSGYSDSPAALGRNIAWSHFLFKVFQVIVFFPFIDQIVKLTYIIIPGEDALPEEELSLKFIGSHDIYTPALAIVSVVNEINRMAHLAIDNLNLAVKGLVEQNMTAADQVYATEKQIDFLDEQISNYLVKINQTFLPLADANRIAAYFHVVNDIERIGDHAENIADMTVQCIENDIVFSPKSLSELAEMMENVNTILAYSLDMFYTGNKEHMEDIISIEEQVDMMERKLQKTHIKRLNKGKCSAQAGIYFNDLISGLERVSDHATNIAFSLVEADSGVSFDV